MDDKDTHRQLLQLVYEYVKANISLEARPALHKTVEVRRLLSEIRRAAFERRKEVMEIQKDRRAELDELKGKSDSTEADDQDS
jgi:hypothetical protein